MSTLSTKAVGPRQAIAQPNEVAKLEKTNVCKPTKSTIASLTKLEPEKSKELTCWQKFKDCFVNIFRWIKEKIFCQAPKKNGTEIEKAKTEEKTDRSESSSVLKQKKHDEVIDQFKRKVLDEKQKAKESREAFHVFTEEAKKLVIEGKWDEIEKFLKAGSKLGEEHQKDIDSFKKRPEMLLNFLTSLKEFTEKVEKNNETIEVLAFLELIAQSPKLTKVQIKGALEILSTEAREYLLESYKAANQKTEFTEDQLLALILEKPTDNSFDKLKEKINEEHLKKCRELEVQFKKQNPNFDISYNPHNSDIDFTPPQS